MTRVFTALAASLLACGLAHAQCESHFSTWAALQPQGTVDLALATCKVWPASPALTLAALPVAHTDNSTDAGTYDLAVLVTDSASGAVLAQTLEPSALTYDAIRLTGLSLDTARYQLTPSQRAFGVRVHYEGSSAIFPFSTTALNLYVAEAQAVRPVLRRLVVESSNGDWDGVCAGRFSTTARALSMGPPGADGYASLQVAEQSSRSVREVSKKECVTREQPPTRSRATLAYRKGQYPTPKRMALDF